VSGYVLSCFLLSCHPSFTVISGSYAPLTHTITFHRLLSIIRFSWETTKLINRYPIRLEGSIRIIHPPPTSSHHEIASQASIKLEAIDRSHVHASLVLSFHAAHISSYRTRHNLRSGKAKMMYQSQRKDSIQASHRFIGIRIRD
jgi:hypothetical protein